MPKALRPSTGAKGILEICCRDLTRKEHQGILATRTAESETSRGANGILELI